MRQASGLRLLLSFPAQAAIGNGRVHPVKLFWRIVCRGFGALVPGQTFTAAVGGLLQEVGVGIWSNVANNVLVEVRNTASGLPTARLASALITGGPYADGTLHTADFSSSVRPTYLGRALGSNTLGVSSCIR